MQRLKFIYLMDEFSMQNTKFGAILAFCKIYE